MKTLAESIQIIGRYFREVPPEPKFPTDRRWTLDKHEDGPTFGKAREAAQAAGKAAQEGEI